MPATRGQLFGVDVPDGFQYRHDFITADEEKWFVGEMSGVDFSNFEMRGVVARRRVAFFGRSYDTSVAAATLPMPAFLLPLRDKLAAWASIAPDTFAMALINEYRAGAPIGWHRDAPQYDIVAGVSLLSPCQMKFRPYVSHTEARASAAHGERRMATHEVTLEPRSAYLMTGASRSRYEHHIPAVATLRYSITFRTLRS